MAKIATTIEQSQQLAKILSIESADMMYQKYETVIGDDYGYAYRIQPFFSSDIEGIPCWSLAALLAVLHFPSLHKTISGWRCDTYRNDNKHIMYGESKDNPVDACVEMILKLHELKML